MFDLADHLDELRSWPTDRLVAHHAHLVREERRLHLERLDVLLVLDERGRVDTTVGAGGESARTVRENVEQARRLEALPNVAAAAHAGKLSDEQLGSVVKLADEASDAEWAARAPNTDPADLARLARNLSKPTTEDGQARREARGLRMWWEPGKGMLHVRGQLPDLMGARFEATLTKLTDRMRPAKGEAWDTLEHRAADALDCMCDAVEVAEQVENPTPAARPLLQVQVRADGPAEIAGIPLPDAVIEQLRAQASIEPVLVDDHGVAVRVAKRRQRTLTEDHAGGAAARRGTAGCRAARCATDSRCTTCSRGRGPGVTTSRTWWRCADRITRCWYPPAAGRCSGIPTSPTGSGSNGRSNSADRHRVPGRPRRDAP